MSSWTLRYFVLLSSDESNQAMLVDFSNKPDTTVVSNLNTASARAALVKSDNALAGAKRFLLDLSCSVAPGTSAKGKFVKKERMLSKILYSGKAACLFGKSAAPLANVSKKDVLLFTPIVLICMSYS